MELKPNAKTVISSIMYTRLLELWTYNKVIKTKLLSKVPSEKELDDYVHSIDYYRDVRQAYIEFCNECDFDVDLHFEESEPQEPESQEPETSYSLTSITHGIDRSRYIDEAEFQEDEDEN